MNSVKGTSEIGKSPIEGSHQVKLLEFHDLYKHKTSPKTEVVRTKMKDYS